MVCHTLPHAMSQEKLNFKTMSGDNLKQKDVLNLSRFWSGGGGGGISKGGVEEPEYTNRCQ